MSARASCWKSCCSAAAPESDGVVKLLIVLGAVALLLWLLFGGRSRGRRQADAPGPRRGAGSEAMVTCAHCGVHLPASEALADRGLHYCSAAHRDASR